MEISNIGENSFINRKNIGFYEENGVRYGSEQFFNKTPDNIKNLALNVKYKLQSFEPYASVKVSVGIEDEKYVIYSAMYKEGKSQLDESILASINNLLKGEKIEGKAELINNQNTLIIRTQLKKQ